MDSSTAHTVAQDQHEVDARHSIQRLQEEEPYYSYPQWNAQQQRTQDTEDDGYIYIRNDSSTSVANSARNTNHERERQGAVELEPHLYEVAYLSTIAVNSTRSSRPCEILPARDCHQKYKQLRIETKDYISMYDVVRTPDRDQK